MKTKITSKLSKIVVFTIIATLILANVFNAFACTSFYMGKDTTENGTTIWGRSEDVSSRFRKLSLVQPAETHLPGEEFVSTSGFRWPYPEKTLRYTYIKDSIHNEGALPQPYAEVGMNEKNVAMTATVTLSGGHPSIVGTRNAPGGVDPMVSTRNGGLSEEDMTAVVLMQATSARHAVEIIANIVDTVGNAGREGIMLGDPNEIWYMQLLSGHQYVAVKTPDNMIGFSPNMTGNVDLTDTENVIASPGLISIPEEAGTLVKDANGNIKVADSYAAKPSSVNARLYVGYTYLFDEATADALTAGYIDYFIAPRASKNYTLYEALRILAYRGEGTKYDGDAGLGFTGGIGSNNNVESHVFETRYNMPDALATVQWMSIAPPEFNIYIPYYGSLVTDTFVMAYSPDNKVYNEDDPDANSVYHVFRELHTLCNGPRGAEGYGSRASKIRYGDKVKEFWERYQKSLIAQQANVDADMVELYNYSPELAEEMATELSKSLVEESYEYAKQILSELKAFQANETPGQFTPSVLLDENAIPHYDTQIGVSINTAAEINEGDLVEFIISMERMIDVMNMEIIFEVDSDELDYNVDSALNGFKKIRPIDWKMVEETGKLEGTVTLIPEVKVSEGITSIDKLDILKIKYNSNLTENATTSMKIKSVKITAWDESLDKAYFAKNEIYPDTATTMISKLYSKYDLNKDGNIDLRDLATAQRFYLSVKADENWNSAKIADVNGDGIVNILDLINVYINIEK